MKNLKTTIYTVILILLFSSLCFSTVSKKQAAQLAGKTLEIFTNFNMILNKVRKTPDITKAVKSGLKKQAIELKKIKLKIKQIRSVSNDNVKILQKEFKQGKFSGALQKTVKNFFENIKRIKKIKGGASLVKIIAM